MAWLKGIPSVTYAVREDTIKRWAWFWIEGMGGELVSRDEGCGGAMRWQINMGDFTTVLLATREKLGDSEVETFTRLFGDHSVFSVDYQLDDLGEFRQHLHRNPDIGVPMPP